MSAIKISFCIPTYNRAAYLERALGRFETHYGFDFPYEIVVADNASTDNTKEVAETFAAKGLPIRYHRRTTNGGAAANITSAFNHASGEYVTYHADDDFLIADGVREALRHLDANPRILACQAPWTLYDEVADRDTRQFYTVDADTTFDRGRFAEAFKFLFDRHVFPEIGIYRASAARACFVPREFCFLPFCYLAHFLEQGAVSFLKRPFYRSVVVSKIAPDRQQLGNEQVMSEWDAYRGGLEYFIYVGMKRGNIPATREARAALEEKCKIFTLNRMAVAVRFWAARKDYIKAYEISTRMAVGGLGEHPEVVKVRGAFQLMGGIQTLVWHAASTAGIKRLMLCGVADRAALADMLRELGLPAEIEVVDEPKVHEPTEMESTLVFVPSASHHARFVALGYKPGLILTDRDLVQNIVI